MSIIFKTSFIIAFIFFLSGDLKESGTRSLIRVAKEMVR